jgi:hypothetical protein
MENKNLNATVANNSNNVAGNGAVAEAANGAANQTVKTFALTVKRVQTIEIDDSFVSVKLTFDKPIPGFVRTKDGIYVEANVDHINFSRASITRQLCALNDAIATYRDTSEGAFNRKQLSIILHGAKLTIKRTLHAAGEIVDGREEPLERDQWFSEIVGVSVSKTAATLLLSALTLA